MVLVDKQHQSRCEGGAAARYWPMLALAWQCCRCVYGKRLTMPSQEINHPSESDLADLRRAGVFPGEFSSGSASCRSRLVVLQCQSRQHLSQIRQRRCDLLVALCSDQEIPP
jgi:hypothetical protein